MKPKTSKQPKRAVPVEDITPKTDPTGGKSATYGNPRSFQIISAAT